MKIFLTSLLVLSGMFLQAQTTYEISVDSNRTNATIYKGLITKYLLQSDTSFKWYSINQRSYIPDSSVVNAFRKSNVSFIIFGGTWCEDTQSVLPKFFKLQEQSGITDDRITFFGVNRKKESLGNISGSFAITNVPTIIVMKGGKEAGRVVEYGKTGNWDKELAEIINQ